MDSIKAWKTRYYAAHAGGKVGRIASVEALPGYIDIDNVAAAERMPLMPFARIATRIGGAITVTRVLLLTSGGHPCRKTAAV
jgi:Na+/citrate or Na+/malate symporter